MLHLGYGRQLVYINRRRNMLYVSSWTMKVICYSVTQICLVSYSKSKRLKTAPIEVNEGQ